MKKTIKGVLLSCLIFPGLGQIYLGKKALGAGFIIGTNIGLAGVIFSILKRIPPILEKIQPELDRGAPDLQRLVDLILQSTNSGSHLLESVSMMIIMGCWIGATGHAYWLGRRQDTMGHASE